MMFLKNPTFCKFFRNNPLRPSVHILPCCENDYSLAAKYGQNCFLCILYSQNEY